MKKITMTPQAQLQRARGTVLLTKKDFFKEHKHLIKLLKVGEQLVKEAKSQQKEVNKYRKRKSK